ncbi:tandem-95 repeat protein [Novipirellula artificiosorum]|uniref:Peptidase metallopeptidase domain-containing protein n=1 Tax=Novipirellula artificiosorum TaxID=2528016 RepID=A0A5C6DYE0_9BACT|nr:tandem-95 repeat protein [Novipirellula artificiosorum]TWU41720.1 hypothetical protein Poly41_00120 [Novipirellula artificiosorum]
MTLRRIRSLFGSQSERRRGRKGRSHRLHSRQMLAQQLEARQLLAGPDLIAIRPDSGALLQNNDTLNIAPREFNLLFQGGANLDESTIGNNSVRLVRSGGDGTFGEANDVAVALGYVGLAEPGSTDADDLQHIVFRPSSSASFNTTDPSSAFPDDTYRIEIVGAGAAPLTNLAGEAFNDGNDFQTTFRLDRGAQVVSVVPQPVSRNTQRVQFGGGVSGGTYTLSFKGETTIPIAFPGTNTEIQSALEALDGIQSGDILVGGTREVTFQGQYAGEQVPLMSVGNASLFGGVGSVVRSTKLAEASNQIVVYFDDQAIDGAEVIDPKFYRLINTAGSADPSDDMTTLPQSVTYDRSENSVVLTFAAAIPEGNYRLDIGDSGGDNSTLSGAVKVGLLSDSNSFSQNGFIGDVGGASNNTADLDLYEVQINVPAAPPAPTTALDVTVQPHGMLKGLVRILDAGGAELASATAAAGDEVLLAGIPIATSGTFYIEVSSEDGVSTGSYSINASVTGSSISTSDVNTTVDDATDLGSLGAAGITISSSIVRQSIPLPPRPGSEDDPGHRQIQREAHISATGTTPTVPQATRVRRYYFPDTLGSDTSGGSYANLITETEKQIVRDIFEIYAQQSGYEFVESPATSPFSDQLMVGKGDLRSLDPTIGPNSGVAGLGGSGAVVLNGAIYDQATRFYGDGFSAVMFHELGHALGLGHAYDVPATMGATLPNDVWPGDNDIVHLQRIVPPNSTDIDMYQFTLSQTGRFSAETFAERLPTPSLLNTALTLYRQIAGGDIEKVAQNDQYFGADSLIDLTLEPGTYFIGVTSTGNTQYDPRVADSGYGGTTDGAYQLKLAFDADRDGALRDVSGTAIDGDNDGTPGGVYSFWFQASDPSATLYVDKVADTIANVPQGNGAIDNPFDEIDSALLAAGNRIVVPNDVDPATLSGQSFTIDDGVNIVTFEFDGSGPYDIALDPADDAAAITGKIKTAIDNARSAGGLRATVTSTVTGKVMQLANIDNLDVSGAPTFVAAPNLVKIVGNGGADQNINTLSDNRPYLVGLNTAGNPLVDGAEFLVPQGVNVMLHAGTLFKMRKANFDAGSSSANISRANSSIQVLGTPNNAVFLRSYHDDSVGGNSDGVGPGSGAGDFGGIVFRDDSDLEDRGIFLNYVNHVNIKNGGGKVFVDANESVFSPIHLVDARPTISFNRLTDNDDAAISASPDSFDDSLGRIGPDVVGNSLSDNTINGLFIRVETPVGGSIDTLTVSGRFDDTDITHILSENLIISGASGGPVLETTSGPLVARAAGRLVVDPGIVMKMNRAVIQIQRGSGSLIAEGTVDRPVVFTSFKDDRYGGSGSFDADGTTIDPQRGDWSGLHFGEATSGSLDHAIIAYGGGTSNTSGAPFNAIEVHQADFRITNSLLQYNASGNASGSRGGLGANASSVIYVRGAQPIIVNNEIVDNSAPAISINANSLRFENLRDSGRSTGAVESFDQFADNAGPMVRLNQLDNNAINGMSVRGEVLTTQSVWDDTDMVHVLRNLITVDNLHHYGGLTLQSSNSESLVVKLSGGNAGFTATGTPQEIQDRVGGTIHVLGTVGHPVILTDLADDLVGAGFTPTGEVMKNTNNTNNPSSGNSGAWRGFLFDEYSNDRNVAVVRELENTITNRNDVNANPTVSQLLGTLAANEKSGDENSRLGFEVSGFISPNDSNDVDVYSFRGTAGTEVWLDIDRTDPTLDAVIEVVNAAGTVLARSMRSGDVGGVGDLNANSLTKNSLLGGDHYTQNFRDPGLRYVLPGVTGTPGTYFVRIRSNPASAGDATVIAGESRGAYRLQVRLRQINEFPGSTVQFADIRFAQTGIDVQGLPAHSPLIGEAGELPGQGATFAESQPLTNLLQSDLAALSISGVLSDANDVDWYEFDVAQTGVQVIGGVNDDPGTVAVVFDLDYSDNAVRGDTTVAVYDNNQNLIYVGRESNIIDDQPSNPTDPNSAVTDLGRGSLGKKDAYIGPVHLPSGGTYYVAVMSDRQLPTAMMGAFVADLADDANALVRLEPVNSVTRIVEDHIGFTGYNSNDYSIVLPEFGPILDIRTTVALETHVRALDLSDVVLYAATDVAGTDNGDNLYTAETYNSGAYKTEVTAGGATFVTGQNDIQDIVIRTDGRMFGYQRLNNVADTVGALVEIDPGTGAILSTQNDNIPGTESSSNVSSIDDQGNTRSRDQRALEITNSDEVDALTFERTGVDNQSNPAPIPEYDVYFSVRESDTASKLYRATQTGDATPTRAAGGNPRYGVLGDIQPAGVTYATTFLTARDAADPPNFTSIRLKSRVAGDAGNFTINVFVSTNQPTAVTSASLSSRTINLRLNATGGPPFTGAGSAQDIVNAINSHDDASQIVTALVYGGNAGDGEGNGGTAALSLANSGGGVFTGVGLDGNGLGPLAGRVTGLSFENFDGSGRLFGVTSGGEFIAIDKNSALVTQSTELTDSTGTPFNFQGLTLGPQNAEGGIYANTFFAITDDDRVVAIDANGDVVNIFDSGNSSQLITVTPGLPTTDGYFTLSFDNGSGPLTTDPISANAPGIVSPNEVQNLDTVAYDGTFTLSFQKDQGGVTSPVDAISDIATTFRAQDLNDFPAAPFVIRVQNEEMLVTGRFGTLLQVTRGVNGTTASAHPNTATVYEVVTSPLDSVLGTTVKSTLAGVDIDNQSTSNTLSVSDASPFPAATPFTIRVDDEEMIVTNVAGNDLTVTRAANSTSIDFHYLGTSVEVLNDTLTVFDAVPFPTTAPFNLRIGNEDLRVVGVSGNQYEVIRGINGTTSSSHAIGDTVFLIDTTAPIAYDASTLEIRNALTALPSIGFGNVNVTTRPLLGNSVNAVAIEFIGDLAAKDLKPLTVDTTALVSDRVDQVTLGGSYTGGTFQLSFGGTATELLNYDTDATIVQAALEALPLIGAGNVVVTGGTLPGTPLNIRFVGAMLNQNVPPITLIPAPGFVAANEQQLVEIIGAPTGGGFTLEMNDPANGLVGTTALIAFDADAAAVQAALEAGIAALVGNVLVTGAGTTADPFAIEFIGTFAETNLRPFNFTNSLTGGTSPDVVIATAVDGQWTNEQQQVEITGAPTGGNFTLEVNDPNNGLVGTTPLIAFDADAATVQAALESGIAALVGNVFVTGAGTLADPFTIEFTGPFAGKNLGPVNFTNSLTGGTSPNVAITTFTDGQASLTNNERQQIQFVGTPTAGTFTLSLSDVPNGLIGTTAGIAFNANAAAVQTALETAFVALTGNLAVSGDGSAGNPYIVEFIGAFADTNITQFTFASNLVGTTGPGMAITTLFNGDHTATVTRQIQSPTVAVPLGTDVDGTLSVNDALLELATINANDIQTSGFLPDPGVTVRFTGQYLGTNQPALFVDNFLMLNGSAAQVAITGAAGDGLPDDFVSSITGMSGNSIGLAFSPVDFNLWHPTMMRASDAGHGINQVPDSTRTPADVNANIIDAINGGTRNANQSEGGASFYFGFEQWVNSNQTNANTESYINPEVGTNAQYGIRTQLQHQDLSSTGIASNSYNLPGGALGSLQTSDFSLAGTSKLDRPTLYFSYFLETEDYEGRHENNVSGDNPFRDSARVFASRDGGVTWELLATNNSQLSNSNVSGNNQAELPGFLSHLSDAGLNSADPRSEQDQMVQELFDNTGQWRQARIDLSTFAGESDVQLRFDFSTAGMMGEAGLPSEQFGRLEDSARSIRSLNNDFEGFYVDDIIVGYAERGEMVSGTIADSSITDLYAAGARTQDTDSDAFPDIVSGPYQLEIRRSGTPQTEHVLSASNGPFVSKTFETNDRHINIVTETASVTFEAGTTYPVTTAEDTTLSGNLIPAAEIAEWQPTSTHPYTGSLSLESGAVSQGGATPQLYSVYHAQRSDLSTAGDGAGVIEFSYSVSSAAEAHGLRFLIDGVAQKLMPPDPDFPSIDTTIATGDLGYRTVQFSFSSGDHLFEWVYDFSDTSAAAAGLNRAFIDDVRILQGGTGLVADRNRDRAQGVFVIDSNFITDSSVVGINVQPGTAEAGGSVPHPGSTINFPQLNTARLVPGVVIQNNLVAGSSGIRFAGENTADPQRPVPFGKIVNNTLVGDGQSGIGIDVVGLASPNLMNNLMTDLAVGIQNGGTGTIISANFFQNNAANGATGGAAITPGDSEPLFVDAANRNYYLEASSAALDSSQDVEQDRANFVTFKSSLLIPASPTAAPNRDVYGQLRVDSGGSGGGTGADVFKDRGAVDRSDTDQPYAVLLNPVDNDVQGQDRDPNATVVHLTNPLLENFKILLGDGRGPSSPFEGTGVNGLTVEDASNPAISQEAVKIVHNGRLLVENVDYSLGYNTQTGVLLLSPLSALWEQSGVYTITLDNTTIADLAGNPLRSNQTDGSTQFFILMPDVQLDYGDAPDSFGTLLASNSARHTIQPGATPRLGSRVDGESDASMPTDDTPQSISVASPSGSALFVLTNTLSSSTIAIDPAVTAVGGEQITVQIGPNSATFELVATGFAAKRGNIAVPLSVTDDAESLAVKLADAIDASLVSEGDAAVVSIDAAAPATIAIDAFDDEDGLTIGIFNDGTTDFGVFLKPGAPVTTIDPADVLGFLNPLDQLGTAVSINASSAGMLDAWIDFNGDGAFGPTEQIFTNQPLTVGDNTLQIVSPLGSADGMRWARFRISEEGNLGPDELAIGGEVEDYQVQIINVEPTIPADDTFTIAEDGTLDTETDLTLNSLFVNDAITGFLPPRFVVNDQPTKGTLTVTDPLTGRFVYQPFADFHGQDSFTYWVSTQPVPGSTLPADVELATVTINVTPVNDTPMAADQTFVTLEETAITVTAQDLLNGAVADELAEYPPAPGTPAAPWNEDNQTLTVLSVELPTVGGNTVVTAANAASGPFVTDRGQYEVHYDTSGNFTDLVFTPNTDLNRDNQRLVDDPILLEAFSFTITDSGESIDPDTGAIIAGTPLTATRMVSIEVKPINDTPVANNDVVSEFNVDWVAYFVDPEVAPVPSEDTDLVIPHGYLLRNDFNGPATAHDELDGFNDGALTVTAVDAVSVLGGTVSIVDDTIVYRAPENVYGLDTFVYTITDTGIDEDASGVRTDTPLTTTATVTVLVKPINDTPLANDLDVTMIEAQEFLTGTNILDPNASSDGVGFKIITAADLLRLGGTGGALEATFSNGLDEMYDEHEQDLRVVGFGLPGSIEPDVDAATLVYDASDEATATLATASGTIEFFFKKDATGVGALVHLVYTPNTDYNNNTEFPPTDSFIYFVEDFGELTVYGADQVGEPPMSVDHGSLRSAPATVVMTVTPVNDVPIFPDFGMVSFEEDVAADGSTIYYDVYNGTIIDSDDPAVNGLPEMLFVSADTALDERARESLSFTYATVYEPAGMFASLPVFDTRGVLTLTPNPDAYGYAVFTITVTDTGQSYDAATDTLVDAFHSVTRTLTVNITPVNDPPVTFDRDLEVDEVEEFTNFTDTPTGQTAVLVLTPDSFLTGSQGLSKDSDFADDVETFEEFDEDEQTLRVVEFTVTDSVGDLITVDKDNFNGTEITLATGKITFNFDVTTGGFISGEYLPNVNLNERTPFVPTEVFSYIIEDFGATTIPGADQISPVGTSPIDYTTDGATPPVGLNHRSEPKQVTIRTRATNDAPEFAEFATVTFAEDVQADNTPIYYDVYGGAIIASDDPAVHLLPEAIFVSRDTALDERDRETLTFSTTTTYEPDGMFAETPVLDQYGVLKLTPNPDVYGYAVFEITATDDGQSYDSTSGTMVEDIRSTTRTLTVHITPVNDAPVAFDRNLEVTEVEEFADSTNAATGAVARLPLAPADFLGGTTENPELAEPSDFTDDVDRVSSSGQVEYDEEEQSLRVVEFTVTDVSGSLVTVDKDNFNGTEINLATGRITFHFDVATGEFTEGEFFPSLDMNERTPFDPTEVFSYIVEDFGATTIPGADQISPVGTSPIDYTTDGATPPVGMNNRSESKLMTIRTRAINDAPEFPMVPTVRFFEDVRPDNTPVYYSIYTGSVINSNDPADHGLPPVIFVSRSTAQDERDRETLTFSVSTVNEPPGMFASTPVLDEYGVLTLTPNPDVYGYAVFDLTATDDGQSYDAASGSMVSDTRNTTRRVTVNIRPVNDQPIAANQTFDPVDESVEYDAFGNLIDPLPQTMVPFDGARLTQDALAGGFLASMNPIYDESEQQFDVVEFQLLDSTNQFVVIDGDDLGAGLQVETVTSRTGGVFTFSFVDGVFTEGSFAPARDYNEELPYAPLDGFNYVIRDRGAISLPGSDPASTANTGSRRSDPAFAVFRILAVNDPPIFTLPSTLVESLEDAGEVTFEGTAIEIGSGGGEDEVSQDLEFTVAADGFLVTDFFSNPPSLATDGGLTFAALPDVFGSFVFDVTLRDNPGELDTATTTKKLTIAVRPQNDAPLIDPSESPLNYFLAEDTAYDVPLVGDASTTGLLDIFLVGPDNETSPVVGGNQNVSMASPLPNRTAQGGTLTPVLDSSNAVVGLRYQPRQNFVGIDTFVYTITDDGISVDLGTAGTPENDFLTTTATATFTVSGINDPPQFSGAGNHTSAEDQGSVVVNNWATSLRPGPADATDEASQTMEFVFTPIDVPVGFFAAGPSAVISGRSASLVYTAAPDVFGEAVFSVFVRDSGNPTDPVVGHDNESDPVTFTITVTPVNDIPTFTAGDDAEVLEDSAPFEELNWATDISPGPANESDQTVRFEVATPTSARPLFAAGGLPAISDSGTLSFTVAENASGTAIVQVTAIDSEDGVSETVNLTITIVEQDDPVVSFDDTIETNEDAIVVLDAIELTGNDVDPDLETNPAEHLTIVMPASQITNLGAMLTYNSTTEQITYDPSDAATIQALKPGESDVDSFTYVVRDISGNESESTVVVNIDGVNDAPILTGDQVLLNEAGATIILPLANDVDVDGTIDPSSIIITTQPKAGALTVENDGTVRYTPFASFNRSDSFYYTVADNLGQQSNPAQVVVSLSLLPNVPDFDNVVATSHDTTTIDVGAVATAVDGTLDLTSLQIIDGPSHGTATTQDDGTIDYIADGGYIGPDSYQFTITDSAGRVSEPSTVTINVVAHRLQNPDPTMFSDVNANGQVTAHDALLIINRLSEVGNNQSSIPVTSTDVGPNYYDTTGDDQITSLDALRVINQLSAPSTGGGSGEQVVGSDFLKVASIETSHVDVYSSAEKLEPSEKVVDTSSAAPRSTDVFDLIAEARESETKSTDEEVLSAVDEAFADLL